MMEVRLQCTLAWDFWFQVVWPNKPISAPDKCPKIFSILVPWIRRARYSTFRAFRVYSVYLWIHSTYSHSQYMYRFIFLLNAKIYSVYLAIRTAKFRSNMYLIPHISDYTQIHSVYFQYMNRFIPHIRQIGPYNFEYPELSYFLHTF